MSTATPSTDVSVAVSHDDALDEILSRYCAPMSGGVGASLAGADVVMGHGSHGGGGVDDDDDAEAAAEDDMGLMCPGDVRARCPRCRVEFRDPAAEMDVGVLLRVPLRHDALLSVIGSSDVEEGLARDVGVVEHVLRSLHSLLRLALDPDMTEELCVDFAAAASLLDDRLAGADITPSDLQLLVRTDGCTDFLVCSGFEHAGAALYFWRDPDQRPCQRALIGLTAVTAELEAIARTGKGQRSQPIMSLMGKHLTKFDELQKRLEAPAAHFPTFHDDLLPWLELRSYFYTCIIVGGPAQAETWIDYFVASRDAAQQVVERIESAHRALRLEGSRAALLRHSTRLRHDVAGLSGLFDAAHRTPVQQQRCSSAARGIGGDTPTPHRSPQSAARFSPGDLLTRTPQHGTDREDFRLAAPPLSHSWRDPSAEPAGLLNMRQCCYINCLLQVLFRDRVLVRTVMAFPRADTLRAICPVPADRPPLPPPCAARFKVAHRLQSLFAFMSLSAAAAINPVPLLDAVAACAPQFSDGQQHDPHEFATALLTALDGAFDDLAPLLSLSDAAQEHGGAAGVPTAAAVERCLEGGEMCAQRGKNSDDDDDDDGAGSADATAAAASTQAAASREARAELRAEVEAARTALQAHLRHHRVRLAALSCDGDWTAPESDRAETHALFLPLYVDGDDVAFRRAALSALGEQCCRVGENGSRHVDPSKTLLQGAEEDAVEPTELHWSVEAALGDHRDVAAAETVGVLDAFAAEGGAAAQPRALFCYLPSRCGRADGAAATTKNSAPFSFPATLDLAAYTTSAPEEQRRARREMMQARHAIHCARRAAAEATATAEALRRAQDAAPTIDALSEEIATLRRRAEAAARTSTLEAEAAVGQLRAKLQQLHGRAGKGKGKGGGGAPPLELRGVIVHRGASAAQGHYISYVAERIRRGSAPAPSLRWLRCDDVRVAEVDPSEVFSEATQRTAYCLFFAAPDDAELRALHHLRGSEGAATVAAAAAAVVDEEGHAADADDAQMSPTKRAVPPRLRALIEQEDARRQLRLAQRLSAAM